MRHFPTLFKVDPTIVDECTEEILLERAEEKRIRRINEVKEEGEKKLKMSSHTEGAIKPVAIRRFSRFITCHVRQKFGAAEKNLVLQPFPWVGNWINEGTQVPLQKEV